jgi:hypothetical protein
VAAIDRNGAPIPTRCSRASCGHFSSASSTPVTSFRNSCARPNRPPSSRRLHGRSKITPQTETTGSNARIASSRSRVT